MLLGILMFISFIVFMAKVIGLKKAAKYHIAIDVIFTALAAILLGSTLGGLTAAIAAGLLLSIFFWLYRATTMNPQKEEYYDRSGVKRERYPESWKIYI